MGKKKKQEKSEKQEKKRKPDSLKKLEKQQKPDKQQKPEKQAKPDKQQKPGKQAKLDKQQKPEKQAKPDKQQKPEKQVKPDKQQKPEKQAKPDKQQKPEKQVKPDKQQQKPEEQEKISARDHLYQEDVSVVDETAGHFHEKQQMASAEGSKLRKRPEEVPDRAMADILKAFGDASRMQILDLLRGRELSATELLGSLDIVQSTLSHHMKILTEAGIVRCRKQGRNTYYSIDREILVKVSEYIIKWGQQGAS